MSTPPPSEELRSLTVLAEVPSFTASEQTSGGYAFAVLLGRAFIAWMSDPDPATWWGQAASADRLLRFRAEGRRGERIRATDRGDDVALFTRRLNRGGGELELATGERATLLPSRLWRPAWHVRTPGRNRLAEVISLPERPSARLTWRWQGDERSAELAICACFAILASSPRRCRARAAR